MPIAPLHTMTLGEIHEYVEKLESENRELRRKTNNAKKLDQRDADRIRSLYDGGNWSQAALAEAFNVNDATISRIVRNVYYPEVSFV